MRYYSESQLGPTRARTPEGFLICADVPIARTGVQEYDAFEIQEIEPGDDGIIHMERPEAEVFAPATIASFEGKPVTNDHPDGEMVDPGNWRKYLVGHVQNVRRGSGAQSDLLLGDLFINDPGAIDDILSGKVQVSCGYDHEIEVIEQGRGRQTEIVGNHVALVDLGRCGPRCAIGDSGMSKKAPISDWLRRAFRAKDSKEFARVVKDAETVMGEGDDGAGDDESPMIEQSGEHQVHIHLAPAIGDKAKDAEKEKDKETMDSVDAVALGKRMDSLEAKLGRIADALGQIVTAGRDRGRRGDDMEMEEDAQDPMLEDGARDAEEETEEEKEERKRKEREAKDARGRDDFEAAPGNRSGRRILGEMEFSDPLGDRARRAARSDRSQSRREAGARDGARRSSVDSSGLRDAFDTLLADAEVIIPGVRLMSFDAAIPRAQTIDRMCAFRRRVLGAAMDDDDARGIVIDVNGGEEPDLRKASCDAVKSMFGAAAAVRRRASEVRAPSRVGGRDSSKSFIQRMQEANNKMWNTGA